MSTGQVIGDLERLRQVVLEKAQAAAQATLAEARQRAAQITQEAEARAKEREEELIRSGLNAVERARKRIISQTQLKLKGELLERKAAILTDIIDEIRERFERMRSERSYLDLLLTLVRGALSGESRPDHVLIYLNEKDLQGHGTELRARLGEELGLELEKIELCPMKIAGGAIVELPERRLQFDSSLEQILKEFKPEVERLVQEMVFTPLEAEVVGTGSSVAAPDQKERGEAEHGTD